MVLTIEASCLGMMVSDLIDDHSRHLVAPVLLADASESEVGSLADFLTGAPKGGYSNSGIQILEVEVVGYVAGDRRDVCS